MWKNDHLITALILLLMSCCFSALAQPRYDMNSSLKKELQRGAQGTVLIARHRAFVLELSSFFAINPAVLENVLNKQMAALNQMDHFDDSRAMKGALSITRPVAQFNSWVNTYQDTLAANRSCACNHSSMDAVVVPEGKSSGFIRRNYFYVSLGPAQFQPARYLQLAHFVRLKLRTGEVALSGGVAGHLRSFSQVNLDRPKLLLQQMVDEKYSLLALAAEIAQHNMWYLEIAGENINNNSKAHWSLHNGGFAQHKAVFRNCLNLYCGVSPLL